MKIETLHTHFEKVLNRAFELSKSQTSLTGLTSPTVLGFLLSQISSKQINGLPHLIICDSDVSAERLGKSLRAFDPQRNCHLLKGHDVSPYSGLYPSPTHGYERLRFLYAAHSARPTDIFICSAIGLLQKTIPFQILARKTFRYEVGDELPEKFESFLVSMGYRASPLVEDCGSFALRGGVIDIFPPNSISPIRVELFGDQIESIRYFDLKSQRSSEQNLLKSFTLIPAHECLYEEGYHEKLVDMVRVHLSERTILHAEKDELLRSVIHKTMFPGIEFLLPYFYPQLDSILDHFSSPLHLWFLDELALTQVTDSFAEDLEKDFAKSEALPFALPPSILYSKFADLEQPADSRKISMVDLEFFSTDEDADTNPDQQIRYSSKMLREFSSTHLKFLPGSDHWLDEIKRKLQAFKSSNLSVFICFQNTTLIDRAVLLLEKMDFVGKKVEHDQYLWDDWTSEQKNSPKLFHLIPRPLEESFRLDEENIVFLRDEDFFGKKAKSRSSSVDDFNKKAKRLNFGDLSPNDLVVHAKHGVGQYEGLKLMLIGGVENEFIQVSYKGKDKLYLPVYRIGQLQKYAGSAGTTVLDRLGDQGFEKTKSQVKKHLQDLAADLLKLYAARAEIQRPPFLFFEDAILQFDNQFPYGETDDQLKAIADIKADLSKPRPMDRLVCGDVGFGKTEVAMRAAFFILQNQKQVAILAPTTVLTFQHFENFKKRFAGWPYRIEVINRFVSNVEAKKIIEDTKNGLVKILIGTHRLLSKDIAFADLGLLIVDEEQKFGVAHKEKIKKVKLNVDTIALSATPIPRTLNMALMGVRDLSLINTAPVDRLPTRTFVSKFDEATIRKAITSEIARGGQVYFIHNRVQSIYGIADEVRAIVPEARIRVGHGQMEEEELEKTMLAFFNHEIDVLVCTSIVESGMDVSRANTMFIESAHLFGLSQLYQLRGRVGRSKSRAYCFLMLPRGRQLDKLAQERLKVIQENTELGSGIKIAQYDLELRGSGNILGEDQSGHVNSVGYEMYMDLLAEALAEAQGKPLDDFELEPEINLRIAAMIPDTYISDIRLRLSYYKALADIKDQSELDLIEEEMRDQFGKIPEPVVNLMGIMLIRRQCKNLGVRDISAGPKNISLIFTDKTKLPPQTAISLAMRENKKYSLTPDQRLNVRMNNITWSAVFEELQYLLSLAN
ncbi:MAG: transcription-repair coupling factor [Pseudobdellovibrionaceae bacterium]